MKYQLFLQYNGSQQITNIDWENPSISEKKKDILSTIYTQNIFISYYFIVIIL